MLISVPDRREVGLNDGDDRRHRQDDQPQPHAAASQSRLAVTQNFRMNAPGCGLVRRSLLTAPKHRKVDPIRAPARTSTNSVDPALPLLGRCGFA